MGVLIIGSLLLQTGPVKQKLARVAENKASEVLNGSITIGELNGTLFTNLGLTNLLWEIENDTLAYIPEISVSYRLLSLLHNELLVQSAKIKQPYFNLKQENDSTWNVQHLVKNETTEPDTSKSAGNFKITIAEFLLDTGKVTIQSVDTVIPKQINQININLSGNYSSVKQQVQMNNLAFQTHQPSFNLVQLAFNFERDEETISLNDFHLKTAQNALQGKANYAAGQPFELAADMKSEPVNLEEFEFFIPNFKLGAKPKLDFETRTVGENQEISLALTDNGQIIKINATSENLRQFLADTKNTVLNYQVNGDIENVDLAHWLGDPELKYKINGIFDLNGEGIDPKTATVHFNGDFRECLLADRPVDELAMEIHLAQGNLSGDISGSGNFGYISVTPEIKNLQTDPSYQLVALTKNLNLAPLIGNDSLQSDINLNANIAGKGFDPEILNATANIVLENSEFYRFVVDSLEGSFGYHQKDIVVDSLWAKAQSLQLKASGNYHLEGNSDVKLRAEIDSLQPFWKYMPLDSLFANGVVNAHLQGISDSLLLTSDINLNSVEFSGMDVNKIHVKGDGKLTPRDTTFSAEILANQFRMGDFLLDSIKSTAEYFTDSLSVQARVVGEEMESEISSTISLGATTQIQLSDWKVDFKNQHLELMQSPAIIELDSQSYRISNFKMASSMADSAQNIFVDGFVSRNAEEDFKLEVTNVDIVGLLESLGQEIDASGKINLNLQLTGDAMNPKLNGGLSVDKTIAYGYRFSELGGDFSFTNNQLTFYGQIVPQNGGSFDIEAELPFSARLDSMNFNINNEDPISGNIQIDSFPISVLQFLDEDDKVKGAVNGNIKVGGTFESPDPSGEISLNEAEIVLPEYGIEYRNIIFELSFSENAAQLDSFYIKTDDGVLKASGTVDFSTAFYRGDVSQSEITLHFNKFNPFDHRQFNMQLSGDASLNGEAGDVVFSGDLTVPEAEVYLPAVMNMMGRVTAPEIPDPLLVRELQQLENNVDTLSTVQNDTAKMQPDTLNFDYLDGFTGSLNIEFPSNTWIKNKDMYVEISGDLELIKNVDYFEVFGTIDVVRGQYDLLGKIFKIQEGSIAFQGGEEIIPQINITAIYAFRNSQRAEQKLKVVVTGQANNPSVNFTLDGSSISEGDALSYILFGRGMNELTTEQQENVTNAGNLASSAAASILSSQLTDLLGRSLDVDYIEVKGDGDFDNATVVVGKYITNDLFVSYEQRFGEIDEKEMAKYEVKLEYELFKFLFLQLDNSSNESGFDVIFKLNSK